MRIINYVLGNIFIDNTGTYTNNFFLIKKLVLDKIVPTYCKKKLTNNFNFTSTYIGTPRRYSCLIFSTTV